jgi:gamma-glutamyltranspeptidase/glutathione hydrolase
MRFLAALLCTVVLSAQDRRGLMRPVIRGAQYAVSTRKPQSTQVAERILRAGGNAFDAAVASQAALAITDAASNGVGSDAFILLYDAKSGSVFSVNAEGTAPKLATIDWYQQNAGGKIPVSEGLLSGTVPGVVDAWYVLLDRWGTMTFAQVLEPAIELAERGFPLSEGLARGIAGKKLQMFPSSQKVYFPGGKAPEAGEVFRNPDLARTLKMLVEAERKAKRKGRRAALRAARDRFYKGDIARQMAAFSEANGGLFRYEDFASYTAKVETPVSSDYRGYAVFKNPSANQGPAELFALNILRGYDLKSMGHNSADYIHVSVEAVKLAMADREAYLADADFVRIPFPSLLAEPFAASRRGLIDMARASHEFRPGRLDDAPLPSLTVSQGDGDHEGDTSYLAVVDRQRNAVSWTPSLHSGFGTGVVMGDLGFTFNCRGDYFKLDPNHPNSLQPGKRPRSTLTPTLILKDGKPFLAVGSPGGDDQTMRIFQTFLNIVEFGMNVQAAIEAPRWTTTSFPSSVFPHQMKPGEMAVEDRIPPEVRQELERRGHKVQVRGPWTLGATSAILVDPATNVLSAGADPRGDNYALAW